MLIHKDVRGQTVIEYVLVLLFIVLGLILAFGDADVGNAIGDAAGRIQNGVLDE